MNKEKTMQANTVKRIIRGTPSERADTMRDLERRVARTAKVAIKNGLPVPTISEVVDVAVPLSEAEAFDLQMDGLSLIGDEGKPVAIEQHVTIENALVKIEGYNVIGKVDTQAGVVSLSPSASEWIAEHALEYADDLVNIRENPRACCHCGAIRKRKLTVLLECEETREIFQVGRSCLKDFTGIDAAASFFDVDYFGGEDEPRMSFGMPTLSARSLMSVAVCQIRENGFASRKDCPEGGSTSDIVKGWLLDTRGTSYEYEVVNKALKAQAGAKVSEYATAIVEHMKTMDTTYGNNVSQYLTNLQALFTNCEDAIPFEHYGLAVSAVSCFMRHEEREAAKAAPTASAGFLGKEGDRIGSKLSAADRRAGKERIERFEAKVVAARYMDRGYDGQTMLKFQDEDGRVLVWWASGLCEFDIGERVRFVGGTVKRCGEYRGVSQTTLTRCRVERM